MAAPSRTQRRPLRLLSTGTALWLTVAAVLVGLGLRVVGVGELPLPLAQWLPWHNPPAITLYFPDSQGRFLVPVTRHVRSEQVTPEGAVQELLKGPEDRAWLGAVLPSNARLASLSVDNGVATVELNTGTAQSDLSAPLSVNAVSRTLQGFLGVGAVRLIVNGSPAGEAPAPPAPAPLVYSVYGPYLVPVASNAASPEEALRHYLSEVGERLEGLPSDVLLREYRFDSSRGLAYANFTYSDSVRKLAVDDPDRMRLTLTGIIATLTGFPEVKAAMLDFQGHARLGLGQCADLLRAPQVRPRVLNDEALVSQRLGE